MPSFQAFARFALASLTAAALAAGCAEEREEPGPDTTDGDETVVEEGAAGRESFCAAARCPEGAVCDEATDQCVTPPDGDDEADEADFCPLVLCPPGTVCNEAADRCEGSGDPDPPEADFCPLVLCPPGAVCDESADACVPVPAPDFCPLVLCPVGTYCDEEADACVVP